MEYSGILMLYALVALLFQHRNEDGGAPRKAKAWMVVYYISLFAWGFVTVNALIELFLGGAK